MKQRLFLFCICLLTLPVVKGQKLTTELQLKRNSLEQAAAITAEVMKNPQAKQVVVAGILGGYYADESILFSDLMNVRESKAYAENRYLGDVPVTAFADEFNKVLRSGAYPNSERIVKNSDLLNYLTRINAQIYFPYSENFLTTGQLAGNPCVTFHPIDNEDVNNGLLLGRDGKTYTSVVVKEDYVMLNPTFIVNYFEGDPSTPTVTSGAGSTATPRSGSGTVDCSQPPLRFEVKIDHFRFDSQWDGLFAGGPEFYVCRGDIMYNSAGTQVTSASTMNRLAFKRRHKGEWRNVQTLWDPRWEFIDGNYEELEQHCIVYEDDENSSTTVSLTGGYKVNAKLPLNIGVETSLSGTTSHTYHADDDMVFNQQWDRCWFINTNNSNQGLGTHNGLAARGVGGSNQVRLTMRITPW